MYISHAAKFLPNIIMEPDSEAKGKTKKLKKISNPGQMAVICGQIESHGKKKEIDTGKKGYSKTV